MVLFESFERLWQIWGLILNEISPSYHLAGVSPLPVDVGYLFLLGSNILLLTVVQRLSSVAQSCLTVQPHGLYSPWNSLGQNTGVGSLSLLQGLFLT